MKTGDYRTHSMVPWHPAAILLLLLPGPIFAAGVWDCLEVNASLVSPFCSSTATPARVCATQNIEYHTGASYDKQAKECTTAHKRKKQCDNDSSKCQPLTKDAWCGGRDQPCAAAADCLSYCWADCFPCNSEADCELLVDFGIAAPAGAPCWSLMNSTRSSSSAHVLRDAIARLKAQGTAAEGTVLTRRYVLSESAGFDTEADNGYAFDNITVVAGETALVLVDVWDDVGIDPMLGENELHRMVPLLAAARKLGMLIVHAPSEGKEWAGVGGVRPGELLVTGTNGTAGSASRCDAAIRLSGRTIRTVLVTGYDTNKCVVDKPCGMVSLSAQLPGAAFILLRDVTRGQYGWLRNSYFGQTASANMLELAPWRNAGAKAAGPAGPAGPAVRSALLKDLLAGFGLDAEAAALEPLALPKPSAVQIFRPAAEAVPTTPGPGERAALVVVSCASDYANDGFAARVAETRRLHLEPLLARFRASRGAAEVIHVPNGHAPDGACLPLSGESVFNTTAAFDAHLAAHSITTLFYVGFAANTDVLFGVGGMQRYYSRSRYLHLPTPAYYWVEECTIGVENAETLEGRWAEKMAIAYRQPLHSSPAGNVVTAAAVGRMLCVDAPRTGPLYQLMGTRPIRGQGDVVTDTDIDGSCGPSLIDRSGNASVTIGISLSTADLALTGRKALCFMKSVGTPWAVYQLRLGDAGAGTLEYQTANATGWATLTVPGFFKQANVTYRLVVVHAGTKVEIWRDGIKVAAAEMNPLDFTGAAALRIGSRNMPAEDWSGTIGDVLIRAGAHPPGGARLPPSELAALKDVYTACGGARWAYARGTDAVGGGAPWRFGPATDPCGEGWFGIRCDAAHAHVVQFFPNTRHSGNPLDGCALPSSFGNLTNLVHAYFSNDKTPSSMHGRIPDSFGSLTRLQCMYFSHTGIEGELPRSLERLVNLEVFLVRSNRLTGPMVDFAKLPRLRNVWFDSQKGTSVLTGNLTSLGGLRNLTFLQASNNPGLTGEMPPTLCNIDCDAGGDVGIECPAALPAGCCKRAGCGEAPRAKPPPTPSMGVCFPQ